MDFGNHASTVDDISFQVLREEELRNHSKRVYFGTRLFGAVCRVRNADRDSPG